MVSTSQQEVQAAMKKKNVFDEDNHICLPASTGLVGPSQIIEP